MNKKPFIGIAGNIGVGKTTFVNLFKGYQQVIN